MIFCYTDNEGQSLNYTKTEAGIAVTDCDKHATQIEVPAFIDDIKVVEIRKKAFLSCNFLISVVIPDSVETIGDWAFASCRQLRRVTLPNRNIFFGKGVFDNDIRLESIFSGDSSEEVASLFASSIRLLETEFLIDPENAGSEEWLNKWDSRLKYMVDLPDDDGFRFMVLCGEEDLTADYDEFCYEKQMKKSQICYERLINDVGLSDEYREYITKYLVSRTKGCDSEAAWDAVIKWHSADRRYFDKMLELGMINQKNIENVLADMNERHAEMKAYLMNYFVSDSVGSFFDDLEL